jgi:hypothetical protein
MKKYLPVNIPVIEFIRRLFSCKKISITRIFLVAIYFIKLIIVMPVGFIQSVFYNRRINKTIISKHPVFILGHYRSGTTYLHKLISADTQFGFVNMYDIVCPNSSLLFGKWLQKTLQSLINFFRVKSSLFNNTILNLSEPAEEERLLMNKGSAFTDYWRFVFPLCWHQWKTSSQLMQNSSYHKKWKKEYMHLLKLASFTNKQKQLALKSPPNTERIKYLLEIFPDAKFVYISRNPYHVFYSTCNLWQKGIKKFCLQEISDEQIEEIVFDEYTRLLDEYEKYKHLIPQGNLVEVSFEELEANALNVLQHIYFELNLTGFKQAEKNFIKKLHQENSYKKFEYTYSKEVFNKIETRWNKHIKLWNKKSSEVFINDYV